jgi:hypothetical protein
MGAAPVNYLNFNLLNKDTQLALLFGGILAPANVQRPKALGDKVDVNLDLFAIAVPVNDEVSTRRQGAFAGLARPRVLDWVKPWVSAHIVPEADRSLPAPFRRLLRDSQTVADFATPASTFTNGFGLGYEYRPVSARSGP